MVTTVWHLKPLCKRDFIHKFYAHGTRVEINKLVKSLHQGVSGHLLVMQLEAFKGV